MTQDSGLQKKAHLELIGIGPSATDPILAELKRLDLSAIQFPEEISLSTGLACALHDLDEDQSAIFIDEAMSKPCHPSIRAMLKSIRRHRTSNFRLSSFAGTTIYEEQKLDPSLQATRYLQKWLGTLPPKDIREIDRIYIFDDDIERDYLGYFIPDLKVITIVWHRPFRSWMPMNWLRRWEAEKTLYHEVGHHVRKHHEPGQIPDQEVEAERFANERFRLASRNRRWIMNTVMPIIRGPLLLVLALLRWLDRRD